jgi:hypothetical protein
MTDVVLISHLYWYCSSHFGLRNVSETGYTSIVMETNLGSEVLCIYSRYKRNSGQYMCHFNTAPLSQMFGFRDRD